MARTWIVLGDRLSSGGQVLQGSTTTDIDGKPVARIGDPALCARHGSTRIASGDSTVVIDGQPVARHGDVCACGCSLIAGNQARVFLDGGGGGGGSGGGAASTAAAAAAVAGLLGAAAKQLDKSPSSGRFDQALRFLTPSREPLANVPYVLELDNGEQVSGTTDADGATARIETDAAVRIVQATLREASGSATCCTPEAGTEDSVTFPVQGAATTEEAYGASVVEVEASGHERSLTAGELEIARKVFGSAVDYSKVKVHNHGYWLFFGFQDKNTAVTPNGEMYFPKGIYEEDYAALGVDKQHWFIHEMVHVWQYQLGYAIKWVRMFRPNMKYEYAPSNEKRLCDFNMEQQGDIVADYFVANFTTSPYQATIAARVGAANVASVLAPMMADFLADPTATSNLPNTKE
ncbi:PAAR domain-containing protein [Stenotrophomonas sp. 24(2023)]|uniref:PAAR domain-containing protein n=1 Tax=Stenotrophomonas sp. 24(2023) TaxID=3068324 RepID=UPI0027DF6F2B|nr:PAAR domain-containing protein [Stenotrophomonas sp. 24(2023)]WMJ68803.1 PAAR domain-containing protein [Stenotrophomonas sp. 24(2023)]